MARCESVDDQQKIKLDGYVQEMDSNDSDSEKDYSIISGQDLRVQSKNLDSSEVVCNEQIINACPVFSLQCLHDDTTDDEKESSRSTTKSEFVDLDDVSELVIDCGPDNDHKDLNNEFREAKEEHPHLVPVQIVSVNGSSNQILVSHPNSSLPARNNWDGAHNFKVKIQCSDVPRKSDSPAYSESLKKLYIAKDQPFKVLINAENVPMGCMLKVTAVFSLLEHSYEIVQRCPTHAQQDFSKGISAFEHFVQCYSEAAVYNKNDNGKLTVSVPYEKPQEGEKYTTYLFKLTCFSSCSGGINRRPFMLLFTLEKDNIPLGRQTLDAKVCACPFRDFKVDEERELKKISKTDKTNVKESSLSSSEEKITSKYSISVKDPELYQFLEQMKCLYEASNCCARIKSDT